jgi:hypothetical protein
VLASVCLIVVGCFLLANHSEKKGLAQILLLFGGLLVLGFAGTRLRGIAIRLRMRWTRRTLISQLQSGSKAKVVGKVNAKLGALIAPLSEQECVAYRLKVVWVGAEDGKIIDDWNATLFLIEDESGVVAVDAVPFKIAVTRVETYRGRGDELPEYLLDFLHERLEKRGGLSGRAKILRADRQFDVEEVAIVPGSTIAVLGRVGPVANSSGRPANLKIGPIGSGVTYICGGPVGS